MASTLFQGVEIPNPKNPTGKGQYQPAPAPLQIGFSKVSIPFDHQDYIQAFVAYCETKLQISCNPQTGEPGDYTGNNPLIGAENIVLSTADYGVLKQCEASGNYTAIMNRIGGTDVKLTKVTATLSWVPALSSEESQKDILKLSQTQTYGVTNTSTQTNKFAESIGLSAGATADEISGTLSGSFTFTQAHSSSISIAEMTTNTISIKVPPYTTSQFWKLICTFENVGQNTSLTVTGSYLNTTYPDNANIETTVL